jgi:hypothetical protein
MRVARSTSQNGTSAKIIVNKLTKVGTWMPTRDSWDVLEMVWSARFAACKPGRWTRCIWSPPAPRVGRQSILSQLKRSPGKAV